MKQKPGRETPEVCQNREADAPRFASDTPTWPTSSIPERGVRPEAGQKTSWRLTGDDATQNRLDIRGHIDTARKHGPGAFEVLEHFMPKGIPNAPAPADLTAEQRRPAPPPPSTPVTRVNAYV